MPRGRRELTKPLYADQRWHGIPLSARAKTLATLVVLAIVALGLYVAWLVGNIEQHRSANTDQQRTTRQDIAQLACLLVQDTPPGDALGDAIRDKYGCPDYSDRNRLPTRAPGPTSTRTVTRTASPAPRHASSTPEGLRRSVTGAHPAPRASTVTRTVRPSAPGSATRTSTRPRPTPSPTSSGLLCGISVLTTLCHPLGA